MRYKLRYYYKTYCDVTVTADNWDEAIKKGRTVKRTDQIMDNMQLVNIDYIPQKHEESSY